MSAPDQPRAELLPCPFCGAHAKLLYHWNGEGEPSPLHCWVQCSRGDCGANYDADEPLELAAKLWNTRATIPARAEVTDEMATKALEVFFQFNGRTGGMNTLGAMKAALGGSTMASSWVLTLAMLGVL